MSSWRLRRSGHRHQRICVARSRSPKKTFARSAINDPCYGLHGARGPQVHAKIAKHDEHVVDNERRTRWQRTIVVQLFHNY